MKEAKKISHIDNKTGFTLVELLVVIAIIGILTSVAIVNLNSTRAKARDAKRLADITAIQTTLELYLEENGVYPNPGFVKSFPEVANWFPGLEPYLVTVPIDPVNQDPAGGSLDMYYGYTRYNCALDVADDDSYLLWFFQESKTEANQDDPNNEGGGHWSTRCVCNPGPCQ